MEGEDPDKKWITTWNDYLWRIKYFYRWLYNAKDKGMNAKSYDSWTTPSFINIKMKRTKRLSPYLESEIWDKDELSAVIKYEDHSTSVHDDDIEPSKWKCTTCGKVFESNYILNYHILLEHSKYKRPPTGIG